MGDKRPLQLKKENLNVKENDVWIKGEEAEKALKKFALQYSHKHLPIYMEIMDKEMGKNEHTDIKITKIGEKVYEDVDRESLLKLHKQKFQLT